MKLNIKRDLLKKELALLNLVAAKKAAIPILEHILLKTVPSGLELMATNLDLWFRTEIESDNEKDLSCSVSCKLLKSIVAVCGEDITFEIKDGKFHISSGKAKWQIDFNPAENFPEAPKFTKFDLTLPFDSFREAIHKVQFAITKEQSRFTLLGMKMIVAEKNLTVVATDGHRLAMLESNGLSTGKLELDALIGHKTLILINKMPKTESVLMAFSDWQFFSFDNRLIISRKLSGNFPDYKMVVPKDNDKFTKVDIIALTEAVKQVIAVKASNVQQMKWQFKKDGVSSLSTGRELTFETSIVATGSVENLISLNPQFLLDYCNIVKSGVCEISMKDSNAQIVFEPTEQKDGTRYRYIVMPQRI